MQPTILSHSIAVGGAAFALYAAMVLVVTAVQPEPYMVREQTLWCPPTHAQSMPLNARIRVTACRRMRDFMCLKPLQPAKGA